MDKYKLKEFMAVANKQRPADTIITNCKIVDVFQKRIITGNVALHDGLIVGIGDYQGMEVINGANAYLAPGLIDGHIHLESTYLGGGTGSRTDDGLRDDDNHR